MPEILPEAGPKGDMVFSRLARAPEVQVILYDARLNET